MIFRSLSEPLLESNIAIDESWPNFNAILIFIPVGLTVLSLVIIALMFVRLRRLSMALLILQQAKRINALTTQLPSFISQKPSLNKDVPLEPSWVTNLNWEHALVLLNTLIVILLIANLLNNLRFVRSHIPQLCIEISTARACALLPILQLPLCPSHCQIHLPSTISNLVVIGSCISPTLNVDWPDFKITIEFTCTTVRVPDSFRLSPLQVPRIKKILKQPFFVYLYIEHNGV